MALTSRHPHLAPDYNGSTGQELSDSEGESNAVSVSIPNVKAARALKTNALVPTPLSRSDSACRGGLITRLGGAGPAEAARLSEPRASRGQ
jgi:hypothetical protein